MVEIREALCEKFDQKEGLRKLDAGRHAEPRRWHGGVPLEMESIICRDEPPLTKSSRGTMEGSKSSCRIFAASIVQIIEILKTQ
jgi:hypothetical protein